MWPALGIIQVLCMIFPGNLTLLPQNANGPYAPITPIRKHPLRYKIFECPLSNTLLTLFLQNFRARLSFEILSNSRARFSYGAKPHTSRTMSRTNLACFVWVYNNKYSSLVGGQKTGHFNQITIIFARSQRANK